MPTCREYLSFALYVTLAFSVADPMTGVRDAGSSIADLVRRETEEVRSVVRQLSSDERAFLGRYAVCVVHDPLDFVRFTIESYRGKEPMSVCVERAN